MKRYLLAMFVVFVGFSFAYSASIEEETKRGKPKYEKTMADIEKARDLDTLGELYEYVDDFYVKTAYREKKTELFINAYRKDLLNSKRVHEFYPLKLSFEVRDPEDSTLDETFIYKVNGKLILVVYKDLFMLKSPKKTVYIAGLWDKGKLNEYAFTRIGIIHKESEELKKKAPTKMWPVVVDIPSVFMLIIKNDIPTIDKFLASNKLGVDIRWDTVKEKPQKIDFDFPKTIKEITFTDLDADMIFEEESNR